MNEQFSSEHDYEPGEARESERIRRDIDRTLDEMSDTVDQIQERLHPRALLSQARSAVVSPAGIIGLGIAWLMIDRLSGRGRHESYEVGRRIRRDRDRAPARWGGRRGIERRAARMGESVASFADEPDDRAADIPRRAGDAVHTARETASDLTHTLRDRVSSRTLRARVRAAKAGRAVRRGAQYARDHASDIYDDNPLAVGAAALAAGIVGGLILPSMRDQDKDEVIDRARGLRGEVTEAGRSAVRPVREGGRSVAQRAAGAVREAREAGLGPGAHENVD